jgi:hypothetical protein
MNKKGFVNDFPLFSLFLYLIAAIALLRVGYFEGQRSVESEYSTCSKLEVKQGHMFSVFSKNFNIDIYYNGIIKFGKYDENNNYITKEINDTYFVNKFNIVLDDYIENSLKESEK